MKEHECSDGAKPVISSEQEPYHFTESGLPNVFLVGVKYWTCDGCNSRSVELPGVDRLLNAIAEAVVLKRGVLKGDEIRFLRKRAGKKAAEFAALINKTPEHFSKLENEQLPLPQDTDKLIRFTYATLSGDKQLLSQIAERREDWLNSIKGKKRTQIKIKKRRGEATWSAIEAA
jgi:hypothetical protein